MNSKPSSNMKSAVSSSSSGSEKVSASGGVSGSGYDLEETKSKTNSRMSCASDDSCAINELLEGRMDLSVALPNSANHVVVNIERRTPMLDLLVYISTQYRFNAANYTINAGEHEFKASTPIGSLDVNQISIIPKNAKSSSLKGSTASNTAAQPFKTTFRLQVNLPRNQLMVIRVTPNATIAAIKQIICSEKELDANKYQLVRFTGKSEGPLILDANKTLAFYTINEVTLVSNKNLAQIELQYPNVTPGSQDMSTSRTNSMDESTVKKSFNLLVVSQSNPDFTTIDEKTELNHKNVRQQKKRPAPPPPISSSATLPNKSFSMQMNPNNRENASIESIKNDSNLMFEKVSKTSSNTDNKTVLKIPKTVNHVRQNSGSDSSGYHESVLSSDSPESSSATTLHKLGSMTETTSNNNNNMKQTNALNQKSVTKKRRAPPPPPTNHSTQDSGAQPVKHINGHKHDVNDISDESKVVLECMSDVSLPLSTSSSSSGTASDINNRSLSPIVITQTNGSSTPIQSLDNIRDNSLNNCESQQCSSPSDRNTESFECVETQLQDSNENIVISDNEIKESEVNLIEEKQIIEPLNENDVNLEDQKLNEEEKSTENERTDKINDSNEESIETKETSIILNDLNESNESKSETTSKSRETLPNEVCVDCTAPALTASHDTELSGHDCSEKVAERNIVSNEKPDLNTNDNNCDNQTNEFVIDPSLNNNDLDLEEISIPLPPPSPFQNRNDDQGDISNDQCLNESQPILNNSMLNSNDSNETIIETLKDENHSNQQMIANSDNLMTTEKSFENTIEIKQINEFNENKSQMTTTTPRIVSDEEFLNKNIEVTLQSLNEELDRLDSNDHHLELSLSDSLDETNTTEINNEINCVLNERVTPKEAEFDRKQINDKNSIEIETIRSIFERKESKSPSPVPRVMSIISDSINENKTDNKNQFPITTNGKTTLFINDSQSPTPPSVSSPTTSASPSPTGEDKMSITDEVRHLCRPRVRLTNFSIGSYKKEIDIFESTPPPTAPVKSSTKSYVTFPSVKKEEKFRPPLNASKSKVEITSNSMTAMTTTITKSKTPVIQTLITSAPKINRIQSWSGQKSVCLQERNIKQPVKTNERYVSQISITKDVKSNQNSENNNPNDLKAPNLVVQSMSAKIEDQMKSRSPSPKPIIQKTEHNKPIKEKITISIKPGLESIISSNSNQNNFQTNDGIKDKNNALNDSIKKVTKTSTLQTNNKIEETIKAKTPSPIPPPVPPPIPPPEPQTITTLTNNSSKNKVNTKIFHTKGWNSEKVVRSGDVPKVRHVEPPNAVNVRDQLLNDIKNFGGKNSLKKVSNNSSWKLEVNPLKT